MPATLAEAYISPFHTYTNSSNSSSDLRNPAWSGSPNYHSPQVDYRISDLKSETEDIKNTYRKTHRDTDVHDCDTVIAKLLSCSRCRRKLKSFLLDDRDAIVQRGGGLVLNDALVTHMMMGFILFYIIDRIFHR